MSATSVGFSHAPSYIIDVGEVVDTYKLVFVLMPCLYVYFERQEIKFMIKKKKCW